MKKKSLFYAFLFVFIILSDQSIKFLISGLEKTQSIFIFPGILKLTFYRNEGIAFGISFNPWLAYLLIVIFIGLFLIIGQKKISRRKSEIFIFPFVLISAGAISNLSDRIRFGYTIDYVEFIPLKGFFNLADCAILIGTIIIIYKVLKMNYKFKNFNNTKQ